MFLKTKTPQLILIERASPACFQSSPFSPASPWIMTVVFKIVDWCFVGEDLEERMFLYI